MNLDTDVVKKLLQAFDFKRLFHELGWERLAINPVPISVDHEEYTCTPVAEKRGAQVYLCTTDVIPGAVLRHKIDNRLTRHAREHLLIFSDTAQSRQVWQWAAHTPGQPHFLRSYEWHKGQAGGILTQRLAEIAIPISEEESIDLTLVTHRLKDAFDRDRITKRFYELFEKQRQRFQGSVQGLPDEDATKWYSSVVVNRLMFIYFLQKQGFLDHGDRDYLRKKLEFIQGKDFDQYYRNFLLPLFFDGFSKSERSGDIRAKLGDVPYLNGGLFAPHVLEEQYGERIQIPDAAFTELLNFFDRYQWTLDDRPLANDNEINPDVLGYIFEKYVNQKQMGAYYTKEDITGYISQETIIPRLFDMVKAKYKLAFSGVNSVFAVLKENPDVYIYPAMHKGARNADGNMMRFPDNITQGLNDVSKRGDWNKSADSEYRLPTEIWREIITRTQRYEEVRRHCADGDVSDINDLITYNLDIRQFAQDTISQSEDPVFVLRFFEALRSITILDPTCGSGAFLFAALNILERLYEACLQRMEQFQQDGVMYTGQALRAVQQFDATLREADKHSNRRYYILKTVVVHNLYGVDIMEEAVEICKLRLFLRLVAELKPGQPVEPLPDIDFNIKAGNTLVGYAHLKDAMNAAKKQLFGEKVAVRMQQKAEDLARLYHKMQEQQMTLGGRITPEDKRALQQRRKQLVDELDEYLAYDYGVQTQKPKALQGWRMKMLPFHWFAEFYDIVSSGGFGVVIGNPPYVEYSKIHDDYQVLDYRTESCGNLYAFVLERCDSLLGDLSRRGLIVPLSLAATGRMATLQEVEFRDSRLWLSFFDVYPCKLFEGAKVRLCILLAERCMAAHGTVMTTSYLRWKTDYRSSLFSTLSYHRSQWIQKLSVVPKVGDSAAENILAKLSTFCGVKYERAAEGGCSFFVHRIPYDFVKAIDFVPFFWNEVDGSKKSEDYKPYLLADPHQVGAMLAVLNSSLFYWWWHSLFEGYHCGRHEIESFPAGLDRMSREIETQLEELGRLLMDDLRLHSSHKSCVYEKTGRVEYEEFYPRLSKPIIDKIDQALSAHFGLTPGECDYIVNYYAKFRIESSGVDEHDDA